MAGSLIFGLAFNFRPQTQPLQNNFNFIAPYYDRLAGFIFGNAIRNSQAWLLSFMPDHSRILIIGGGTGWILEEILQKVKNCEILYLEASGKMLQLSRERYAKLPEKYDNQVEFRLGTETALHTAETFEVIFTGFLLDLFNPDSLQTLMQQLCHKLAPKGTWLLADFHPKNATLFWQKSLFTLMVAFFKITTRLQADRLPDLDVAFQELPLHLKAEKCFYHRLIRSAVYRKT